MKTLLEDYSRIGYPSDTGMTRVFSPHRSGDDYPYDHDSPTDEPTDAAEIQPMGHNIPLPHDLRHTAWDDVEEALGSPVSLGRSSPGQMSGVIPGGAKFGNDSFDHEVSDDDLERAGRSGKYRHYEKKDVGLDPVDDIEVSGMSDPEEFQGGSELPSDIVTIGEPGFTQGLGQATKVSRELFGILDSVEGELPKKTVWAYLEQIVSTENPENR